MKIAVASMDGAAMSPHFGRSRCFIVFTVEDGRIAGREVRDNTFTPHAQGECQGGDGHHDEGHHGEEHSGEHHHHDQPHSHAGVIAALHDCQVVVSGGMGWRAAQDLQASGIRAVMADPSLSPDQAAADLIAGKLRPGQGFCRCHG